MAFAKATTSGHFSLFVFGELRPCFETYGQLFACEYGGCVFVCVCFFDKKSVSKFQVKSKIWLAEGQYVRPQSRFACNLPAQRLSVCSRGGRKRGYLSRKYRAIA